MMALYGLIGHPVSHSFSKDFFTALFLRENLKDHSYELFDLKDIALIRELIRQRQPAGLNITIPHKSTVMQFLDYTDPVAEETGAVNCIHILDRKLLGYNTDTIAFREWLKKLNLKPGIKALIFGSGGASRAVAAALNHMHIAYRVVSRTPDDDQLAYGQLNKNFFDTHHLLINCTPAGMWPDVKGRLLLPYEFVTPEHKALDLIYNPEETGFLMECRSRGAFIQNGKEMLYRQAELSWDIWQGKTQ